MKNKLNDKINIIKFIIFVGIFSIFIGVIFTLKNSLSLDNNSNKGKKVDESIVNNLIKIVNLDAVSYPPFPFKKEGRINDYNEEEKDLVIAYYAKRMGLATKGYNKEIDVCSNIECYIIEEEKYKKILETYEIEDYASNNIFKKDNSYYFIFEDFVISEGTMTHNISATYQNKDSIRLVDEITYTLFEIDKSKETYIYNFRILGNDKYSLVSIEKNEI